MRRADGVYFYLVSQFVLALVSIQVEFALLTLEVCLRSVKYILTLICLCEFVCNCDLTETNYKFCSTPYRYANTWNT